MKKVKVRKPKKPAAETAAVKPADVPAETPEGGADQE